MFFISKLSGKVYEFVMELENFMIVREIGTKTCRGFSKNILVQVALN